MVSLVLIVTEKSHNFTYICWLNDNFVLKIRLGTVNVQLSGLVSLNTKFFIIYYGKNATNDLCNSDLDYDIKCL